MLVSVGSPSSFGAINGEVSCSWVWGASNGVRKSSLSVVVMVVVLAEEVEVTSRVLAVAERRVSEVVVGVASGGGGGVSVGGVAIMDAMEAGDCCSEDVSGMAGREERAEEEGSEVVEKGGWAPLAMS